MKVIVCLDDRNGISFNKRRQSRDRAAIQDIITLTKGHGLYVKPYSMELFCDCEEKTADIHITEDFFKENINPKDFIFAEREDAVSILEKVEQWVVYRWNKIYPSDVKFRMPEGYECMESVDFTGYSHEKITRETYQKKKEL